MTETAPGEDELAIDADIRFREFSLSVQVKTTTTRTIPGRDAMISVEPTWIRKWSENYLPVYFLLVVAPAPIATWLHHVDDGTLHRSAAYWQRIELSEVDRTINIPRDKRFTADTFELWHAEGRAAFGRDGSA